MAQKLKPVLMEDIALYRTPSGLHYSPDGKHLAFQVTRADLEKNEYHNDVYIATGGAARRVTWSIDAGIVLWDDAGTLILRRTLPDAEPGTTELFRLSVNGGEAEPWITLPFGLQTLKKLSAEGTGNNGGAGSCRSYIALGSIRAADPDAYLDPPEKRKEKAEAEKEETDYHVVDEIPYWFNGQGYINGQRSALFLVEVKDGVPHCRRLTAPYFNTDSVCVDTEKGIVYYAGAVKKGRESLYNRLYAWHAATGKTETLWGRTGYAFGGLFLLDGQLYFQASDMKAYGVNQTADVCCLAGTTGGAAGSPAVRKAFVPPVTLYSSVLGDTAEGGGGDYAGEGEYLTLATIEDHNAIFSLQPAADAAGAGTNAAEADAAGSLACRTLWEQEGMLCTMTACADRIAVVYQDWAHAAEVFEMDRDGANMRQVTHLNDEALEGRYVAEPRRIDYTSCGCSLRGWVLLPQGFSPRKKYPAVLDVHGGPRCVYGETFFHEMQLWAARGFVVFFTNIKGSDGRGDDFADIRGDYGGTDFRNLMDFTDAVLAAYPNIDTSRLCETGGSYGGFMTNWIIGHTDRFCCAASQRSISNWVSMSFISDIGPFFGPDQCRAKGLFGDANTQALWDSSPLKYAANVKTPTLFIHSEEDYRCPLPEGMQMMQALAANGVETRMVIFKGENHELSRSGKPKHRIRRLKEITEWFEKHTQKEQ